MNTLRFLLQMHLRVMFHQFSDSRGRTPESNSPMMSSNSAQPISSDGFAPVQNKSGGKGKNKFVILLVVLGLGAGGYFAYDAFLGGTAKKAALDPNAEYATVIAQSGLNVRATPSANGDLLFSVANGEKVEVVDRKGPADKIGGKKGNWVKITKNGKVGWVWGALLSFD